MEASLPTWLDDPLCPQRGTTGHKEEGVGSSLPANLGVAGPDACPSLLGSTVRVDRPSTLYAHLAGREGGFRHYMRIMRLCRLYPWLSDVLAIDSCLACVQLVVCGVTAVGINKQMEISRRALEEGPRWSGLTSRVNKQMGSSLPGSRAGVNKQMAISQRALGAEPSDLGLTSRVYNPMEMLQHRRPGSWDTTLSLDAALGCLPRDADLHRLVAVIFGHFVPEPGGRFLYVNCLAPCSIYRRAVLCRVAQEDFLELGLPRSFQPLATGALGDDTWPIPVAAHRSVPGAPDYSSAAAVAKEAKKAAEEAKLHKRGQGGDDPGSAAQ